VGLELTEVTVATTGERQSARFQVTWQRPVEPVVQERVDTEPLSSTIRIVTPAFDTALPFELRTIFTRAMALKLLPSLVEMSTSSLIRLRSSVVVVVGAAVVVVGAAVVVVGAMVVVVGAAVVGGSVVDVEDPDGADESGLLSMPDCGRSPMSSLAVE
jgi:hypothetical protein